MPTVQYQNLNTGAIITSCELYDGLMCGCSAKYFAGYRWENLDTNVIHLGREWAAIWAVTPPPECFPPTCDDPLCPNGRELAYLNIINVVVLTGLTRLDLGVTLGAATFIDNESPVPPTPEYIINWGDGSPPEIITIGIEKMHSVAGLADGVYNAEITWQDAEFEFWYEVTAGEITGYQQARTSTISYNFDCSVYPNYTVSVTDMASIEGAGITWQFTEGHIFFNKVEEHNYTTETVYSVSGELVFDGNQGGTDIITLTNEATGLVPSPTTSQNFARLRTQCIE